MRKIKDINSFELNESLISKFITVDPHDLEVVDKAKIEDFGDKDTPIRKAILNAAYSLYSHFDKERDKSKFIQQVLGMDQEGREKVLNSTKAYVKSLQKIQKIETDEISPNQEGLDQILNVKPQ